MKLMGRTIEWDGWWFDIEPRLIRARPAQGRRGIGGDLMFRFEDMRDDMIFRHIRLIMHTVNVGARIRGNAIRDFIGCPSENRLSNPADLVWNGSKPKYWITPGSFGWERHNWDEHPDDNRE